MTLSTVKQIITTRRISNVSRSKDNKTITTRRMSNISRSKDNKVYDTINCKTNEIQ